MRRLTRFVITLLTPFYTGKFRKYRKMKNFLIVVIIVPLVYNVKTKTWKELLEMKCCKNVFYVVCALTAIIAAIAAIVIFKNEIMDLLAELRTKIEEQKLFHRNGEYADYADV